MRREDRIAFMGLALGLGATIAAMALPLAYPSAPIILWQILLWSGLGIAVISSLVLLRDLVFANRRRPRFANSSISDLKRTLFEKTLRRALPELSQLIREMEQVKPFMRADERPTNYGGHFEAIDQWNTTGLKALKRRGLAAELHELGRVGAELGFINWNEIDLFINPLTVADLEQAHSRLETIPQLLTLKKSDIR